MILILLIYVNYRNKLKTKTLKDNKSELMEHFG